MIVDHRYRGPARSGNGGYTAGMLAAALREATGATTATVTLQAPPPLDVPMRLEPAGAGLQLVHGETVVAEVVAGEVTGDVAGPVPYPVAEAAQAGYRGLRDHPFPDCFTCGPSRAPDDGLRLFPGPVAADVVAAAWTVRPEFTTTTPQPAHRWSGPPWTARAAGRSTWPAGRWCWGG